MTTKERKLFISKSDLSDNQKYLALRYKSITKVSLKEAFSWAKLNWEEYLLYTGMHWDSYRIEENNKYLEKEFISRGYIPRDTFEKEEDFNYIESNQMINGKYYILPIKGVKNYQSKDWGKYPYIYKMQEDYGISGYTRIDVKYSL